MSRLMRALCLAGGFAAAAAAVLPPLNAMAQALFAAHMAQHLILIAIAAPLLSASGIFVKLNLAPLPAWCLFVGIFLFWHWPSAFRWAADRGVREVAELASILFAACLFWTAAFWPGERDGLGLGGRALYVMMAAVAIDLPGVVMVFASTPFCALPRENAGAWGLSVLEDQEIAGLLMWVPANLVFFSIAIGLAAQWLSHAAPAEAR